MNKVAPAETTTVTLEGSASVCLACRETYADPEEHRDHYKSDFHRFNLKRKVVQLPPISRLAFEKSLSDIHAKNNPPPKSETNFSCAACGKHYATKNALEQHLKTKKHVEKAKSRSSVSISAPTLGSFVPETVSSLPSLDTLSSSEIVGEDEENEEEFIKQKLSQAVYYEENQCLFCMEQFNDLNNCLTHMTDEHGLFLPDIEYLVNIQGLIAYLAEKLGVGTTCIYCDTTFRSFQGVQAHMASLSHCKLPNDTDEFEEFYDYTESYQEVIEKYADLKISQKLEGEDETQYFERIMEHHRAQVSESGLELTLPDGRTLGHRSLAKYYGQNYRQHEASKELTEQQATLERYKALGFNANSIVSNAFGKGQALMTTEGFKKFEKVHRKTQKIKTVQSLRWLRHQQSLGVQNNRFRTYFFDSTRPY